MKIIHILAAGLFLSSTAHAGAVDGPQFHIDRVKPQTRDTYRVVFEGEEPAVVRVSGDGSTDLDCYVYDRGGHLIDSDTDSTDECALSWTPAWTGTFSIKIENRGYVSNRYTIRTN